MEEEAKRLGDDDEMQEGIPVRASSPWSRGERTRFESKKKTTATSELLAPFFVILGKEKGREGGEGDERREHGEHERRMRSNGCKKYSVPFSRGISYVLSFLTNSISSSSCFPVCV